MSDWQERLRQKQQEINRRKQMDKTDETPLPITTKDDAETGVLEVRPGGWMVMLEGKTLATGGKNEMVAQARAEGDESGLDTLVYNADGTKGRKYYHS